ncbi:MAG: hypothetical protein LBG50_04465, partial [Clostridiales Family XIII bacterium]|nr:hypothetical protein [Clostridiales Family XIII bacterium]
MRKKVLTGVIVSVLLLNSCLATQVFADEGESTVLEINPLDASVRWANVITVSPSLSFSNGQACCHATI